LRRRLGKRQPAGKLHSAEDWALTNRIVWNNMDRLDGILRVE
jgi:hypothetical protein